MTIFDKPEKIQPQSEAGFNLIYQLVRNVQVSDQALVRLETETMQQHEDLSCHVLT